MSVFIASAILFVIGSAYAFLLKRKLAETFFLAIVTVIAVIYCFGLINIKGCLLYGVGIVCIFAVLCLIYCAKKVIKNKHILFEAELIQGLLMYGIFMAFAMYVGYNLHFFYGDEFSYWGIAVRHMYFLDVFTTSFADIGSITLPGYFPGTSILHYFFTRFGAEFSEYPSYISLNVLYFSLLLPLVKSIFTKKHCIRSLLIAVIYTLIPFQGIFDGNIPQIALSIDTLLAYLFGIGIVYYIINRYEESAYGVLIVSSIMFMLATAKDTGMLFALVICGIILLDTVLFKRDKLKNLLQNASIPGGFKTVIFYVLPLISLAFPILTWKQLLHRTNIKGPYPMPSVSDIISLFTWNIDDAQKVIVRSFIKAMIAPLQPLTYSVVSFIMVFIALSAVILFFYRKNMDIRRMGVIIAAVIFGAILYETALMLYYTFSFYHPNGGVDPLASYTRYTSSCIFGMQIFMLVFMLPVNSTMAINMNTLWNKLALLKGKLLSDDTITITYKHLRTIIKTIPIILSAILVAYLIKVTIQPFTEHVIRSRTTHSDRYVPRSVSAVSRWLPFLADQQAEPLYYISQSTDGWWRLRMAEVGELYPYVKTLGWSGCTIGTNIDPNLPSWPPPPVKFSPDEWEKFVLGSSCKYLYIDISDEAFIKSYGHFFQKGVQNDMLYRVQNNEGHLQLISVTQ